MKILSESDTCSSDQGVNLLSDTIDDSADEVNGLPIGVEGLPYELAEIDGGNSTDGDHSQPGEAVGGTTNEFHTDPGVDGACSTDEWSYASFGDY